MINTVKLKRFQDSLREGMTIQEDCKEYNISLEYAFKHMDKVNRKYYYPAKPTGEQNIQYQHNTYTVRKQKGNKTLTFGSYKNKEDAIRVRDYLQEHGFTKKNMNKIRKELGLE